MAVAAATPGMTEESRRSLVEMARVWSRLADEQVMALPPLAVETLHTAMQQQQQVQPKKVE
jgi:hypothetical protein